MTHYPRAPRVTASTMSTTSAEPDTAGRYTWRDPARCSPERLRLLAAHDRKIALLERPHGNQDQEPRGSVAARAARYPERYARFCSLRAEGVSTAEAARQIGVADSTGRNYERVRKAAAA